MKNNEPKIGTLTFHIAHNYGAMLQAYALPAAVREMGYDCEVIDYRFPYIDQWSRIEWLRDLFYKFGFVGGMLRFAKRLMTGYYWNDKMQIRFDRFEREVIPHSFKTYRNKQELNNMPYDAILFGSDQIWNTALTDGAAEEYIGGFSCLPKTRKIAYAASCGTSDFQPESREAYEAYLKDFYAISVREENFQKTLISRGHEAECVLDPTLLLPAEDWKKIIPKRKKPSARKYLLLYAFDENEKLYDVARVFAKNYDLSIIAVAYAKKEAMYGIDVRTDCGPLEFLSLIANAEHVITTSFHGTVFSINFHRNFHCIPHPKYRERTDSLLHLLGLDAHNVEELKKLEKIETDWVAVDAKLQNERKKSLDFLRKSLDFQK